MSKNKFLGSVNSLAPTFENIKIGSHETTNTSENQHIHFANLKNYFTKTGTSDTTYDDSQHIDRSNYPTLDGSAKVYDLIPIDISFNEFSNLFYNPYSHTFNINITNKNNTNILFDFQHHHDSANLVEQINLLQNFEEAWCEKNNRTLNEMPIEYKIRLRKYCTEHKSLYDLHGTSYSLTLPELIDDMVGDLQQININKSKSLNCILGADVYIDFLDVLIRYHFNYNVQFIDLEPNNDFSLNDQNITFEDLLQQSLKNENSETN